MSASPIGPGAGGTDGLAPTKGWGDVPEADRPVWSRYLLDHCPWFPGAVIMNLIANGVAQGGTRVPEVWMETAAELHKVGFTPLHYYLLADLLSDRRRRNKLHQAAHGHLFQQWYGSRFPDFRLQAESWKPWLNRVQRAESPARALDHMLNGRNLPPLSTQRHGEGSTRVAAD